MAEDQSSDADLVEKLLEMAREMTGKPKWKDEDDDDEDNIFGDDSERFVIDTDEIVADQLGHTGDLSKTFEEDVAAGYHEFENIDPETGKVRGAEQSNEFYQVGGADNKLSETGKVVLDNMLSGKYKRDVFPFKGQVFHELRLAARKEGRLFEDPDFPADDTVLSDDIKQYYVKWKRPHEIVKTPLFINSDGANRFDVNQGMLGNCWFMAALSAFTARTDLFHLVVPPDQSCTDNYAGIFHFQFWHYGKWVDVVIDDRLPTVFGNLVYAKSTDPNEFWQSLIEKAYAKLYGSYKHIEGGQMSEAFEDMTGGVSENHNVKEAGRDTIFDILVRGLHSRSLCAAAIFPPPKGERPDGLITTHAYSLTALEVVKVGGLPKVLLRLRNPWGNKTEWNGDYSDHSPLWEKVDSYSKQRIGHEFKEDGEFWMRLTDFVNIFDELQVTSLPQTVLREIALMTDTLQGLDKKVGWEEVKEFGRWTKMEELSANELIEHNPQYHTTVAHGPYTFAGQRTLIVSLMQMHKREKQDDTRPTAIFLYKATSGEEEVRLTAANVLDEPFAKILPTRPDRQLTLRVHLNTGPYIVVPFGHDDCEFLLRFFVNGCVATKLLKKSVDEKKSKENEEAKADKDAEKDDEEKKDDEGTEEQEDKEPNEEEKEPNEEEKEPKDDKDKEPNDEEKESNDEKDKEPNDEDKKEPEDDKDKEPKEEEGKEDDVASKEEETKVAEEIAHEKEE